jgi:selenocysteine lyase/cysteine desulfurase
VPTVSITHAWHVPAEMAEHLSARHVYAWHGNMYVLVLSERLEKTGSWLRLGLVHYNTRAEIDRLLVALDAL